MKFILFKIRSFLKTLRDAGVRTKRRLRDNALQEWAEEDSNQFYGLLTKVLTTFDNAAVKKAWEKYPPQEMAAWTAIDRFVSKGYITKEQMIEVLEELEREDLETIRKLEAGNRQKHLYLAHK